jgi:aldose 1-epimerase
VHTTPPLLDPARFTGTIGGRPTTLFLLRNGRGMVVAVSSLGAKLLQILVPDRHGQVDDVVLGYDNLAAVQGGSPSMGAFIGRMAGRVGRAHFPWAGRLHTLAANAGEHCLHGGPRGSRFQVFNAQQTDSHTLELQHRFDPAEDGFPGTLDLHLRYRLDEDNTLVIEHTATAVAGSGPASFASHAFFNLAGSGTVDGHRLQVFADTLLATDADNVATGGLLSLDGHELDLRQPRGLEGPPPLVLDHAYLTQAAAHGPEHLCARVNDPLSGRTLDVWSTEPVLQVYTADPLGRSDAPDVGKNGVLHRPRAALCLEPQQYPNAPNCPAFPPSTVAPGAPYQARTRYCFGVQA